MAQAGIEQGKSRKRIITISLVFLILVALYTVGWFYLADKVGERAKADMAKLAAQGVGVQCEDLRISGYPFRVNVVCANISWQKNDAGMAVRAGRLTSGSPVFAPHWLSNELSGPAFVEFPGIEPLEVNWSKFTSSTRLARPFPREVELEARDVVVGRRTEITTTVPMGAFDQIHLKLSQIDDTFKINGRFAALKLDNSVIGNVNSPEIDGLADIEIANAATLLAPSSLSFNERLRGQSGTINQAFLSMPNGAMVSVSGPFSVDMDGLVDANLKVTMVKPQFFAQTGQMVFPEQGGNIATILFALSAMPKDENGNPVLEIAVRKGRAFAGFIPLGRLPEL